MTLSFGPIGPRDSDILIKNNAVISLFDAGIESMSKEIFMFYTLRICSFAHWIRPFLYRLI